MNPVTFFWQLSLLQLLPFSVSAFPVPPLSVNSEIQLPASLSSLDEVETGYQKISLVLNAKWRDWEIHVTE